MKPATGPRPWTIWLFCALNVALASYRSALFYLDLPGVQLMFEELAPWFAWNRDWVIVAISAWLTIDLIPVTLVWVFANRFARWFILCMAGLQLPLTLYNSLVRSPDVPFWAEMLGVLVPLSLAGLLFLPASHMWFRIRRDNEASVFE